MDVQLDILHRVDSQIVVAEERVQAEQANQTKVAEHFVERALSEQIVLELLEQILFVLAELALVNGAIGDGQ